MATSETAVDLNQNDDDALKQKDQGGNQELAGMKTTVHSDVVDDAPEAGGTAGTQDEATNDDKVKEESRNSADLVLLGPLLNPMTEQTSQAMEEAMEEKMQEMMRERMQQEMDRMIREMEEKEKKKKEEEEGKIKKFLGKAPERLGTFLQYSLLASWALHFHVFICLCAPIMFCCEDFCWRYDLDDCFEPFMLVVGLLSMFATPYAVTLFLINEHFGIYDEVQSWQISYCLWSTSCGILCLIYIIGQEKVGYSKFQVTFQNLILWPFGVSVGPNDDIVGWMIPLISIAVAIIGGFFANYALDERYLLKCDPLFTEGMCFEDGLCCRPVGSHEVTESSRFVGDLASNILAGWAVVKGLAYFIFENDQTLDPNKTEKGFRKEKKKKEEDTRDHMDRHREMNSEDKDEEMHERIRTMSIEKRAEMMEEIQRQSRRELREENGRKSDGSGTETVEIIAITGDESHSADKVGIQINNDEAEEDNGKEAEKDTERESEDSKV